jgi:Protein of unknown function (DUF2723)
VPDPGTSIVVFDKRDAVVATVLGVAVGALFLSTFSSQVALGDAPESVAGVRTLGVLHAPGYPSYVLAARAFGFVVPIGSWALRVNLFSVVCASLEVVVTYFLARRFGAGVFGAVLGSLALATTASFWFNADFAKHYPFSALVVTAAALLVTTWQRSGRRIWLIAAGALLGIGIGSSWQLALITGLGLGALLATSPRAPDPRALVWTAGTFVVVAAAVLGFVIVRAHQDPVLNWGDATNIPRLLALVKASDFTTTSTFGVGGSRFVSAGGGLVRDFGAGAIALAGAGAVFCWRRRERSTLVFLGVVGLVNLAAVIMMSPAQRIVGFATVIQQGGYLLGTMVVVAVLAAIGTTRVLELRATRASRQRRFHAMAMAFVLAVVVLVPSIVVHHRYANQRVPAYADDYARRVFAALPRNSVLLVWGEEFGFPLIYRQLVDRDRTDVSVLSVNSIGLGWARAQLVRRFDLGSALDAPTEQQMILNLVAKFRQTRPVFVDTNAMYALSEVLGYRAEGLVGEVVAGVGPHVIPDAGAVSTALDRAVIDDGMVGQPSNRLPYRTVFYFYERAYIELAKSYALQKDLAGAERELQRAVAMFPHDSSPATTLARLQQPGGRDALSLLSSL